MFSNWFAAARLKLAALFQRHKLDRDLDAELQFHLAMREEKLVAGGMTASEARDAARRTLGNPTRTKESSRDLWTFTSLESWWQDLRFAARMVRKNPGFTAVAVLTLALGIGANTAIFSLVDAIMLRPLPVSDPSQLFVLRWTARHRPATYGMEWSGCPSDDVAPASAGYQACSFSYPIFEQFRKEQSELAAISGLIGPWQLHERIDGHLQHVTVAFVSGNFFPTLGVSSELGRSIGTPDDSPAAEPVAVLSDNYWRDEFGRNPEIVGKSIFFEGVPARIVGVSSSRFSGLDPGLGIDVWLPLSLASQMDAEWRTPRANFRGTWIEIVVRPKPGVAISKLEASLNATFAVAAVDAPVPIFKRQDEPRISVLNIGRGLITLRTNFSEPLFLLMAAAAIVLLITCANLAGLILARSAARQPEISVRYALGASRWRIVRQLATENLLTAIFGGLLGILLAYWGAKKLAGFLSANWFQTLQIDVRLDAYVIGFTIGITILTMLFFGLGPVIRASGDLAPSLKRNFGKPSAMRSRLGIGGVLIFTQAALSMVVLAGAGLLVRTLANLETANTGIDARNVLLFEVDAKLTGYKEAQLQNLYSDLATRISTLPGVVSVSRSWVPLLSSSNASGGMHLSDSQNQESVCVYQMPIGLNFLDTMRIPLLEGRAFAARDFASVANPEPAIANQSLVRRFFGTQDPIGRLLTESDSKSPDWEIVGVAGDAKYAEMRDPIEPTLYVPVRMGGAEFEVRTIGDPRTLMPSIYAAAGALNGSTIISNVTTQSEQISHNIYQDRLVADLSGMFGIATLVLVCIGLYGLLSYTVANRVHEIGIRMALGAQPRDVLKLFIRQGCLLALSGTLIGIGVSFWTTRFLKSWLYGVKPVDAVTLVIAAILLTVGALFASWIPSRRAARLDPLVALRHEWRRR